MKDIIFKTNDALLVENSEKLEEYIELLEFFEIRVHPLYFNTPSYLYLYLNKNMHVEAYCCKDPKSPVKLNIFEYPKFLENLKLYNPTALT